MRTSVAVIGAGPGGICAGVRLLEAGIRDFAILEKAPGLGGTWWHNRYPGAECDVQSHLYSFSFAPNPEWSRPFAGQPEILAYLENVAERFGLAPHLHFEREVSGARWNEEEGHWTLEVSSTAGSGGSEEVVAPIVVAAPGMFGAPIWPDLPGLDTFEGPVVHTARWDDTLDLRGRRVAVVGSAASAVQTIPVIAPEVAELTVFQRTPNWVVPKNDVPYTSDELASFRSDPEALAASRQTIFDDTERILAMDDPELRQKTEGFVRKVLQQVEDPEVRQALEPDHPWGCKRPLLSSVYYPTFNRANVELVTDAIERFTKSGSRTADGRERAHDAIVLATGFETTKYASAIDFRGRDGLAIRDAWKEGAAAYQGIATHGFPNLFMVYGPNTNFGSILFMIECQVERIVRLIERVRTEGLRSLEVERRVEDDYNAQLQRELEAVEVWQASCGGYYRADSGKIVTQWPRRMRDYRELSRSDDRDAWIASR